MIRKRFTFRGIIQGVGFRPTVYRCALALSLSGFVKNLRSEVVAEVQGKEGQVLSFTSRLREQLPDAARIDSITEESLEPSGESSFRIADSVATDFTFPPIPPDLALCEQCLGELLDPSDRRYLYPFITCTQCGPRYSILMDTPFDRNTTAMVDFPQCDLCSSEYTDPENRRFHSQTNSCPACGPSLTLKRADSSTVSGDPLRGAIGALGEGKILAIQGIGGFHLAVDPRFSESMVRLRGDKERERKPFALMTRDLAAVRQICRLEPEDARLLRSPASPILILPENEGIPAWIDLVSETSTLGVMLPYTPLHALLFHHPEELIPYRFLVMTSGNLKGEPIVTDPDEAFRKLRSVADLFLLHNRKIVFRTDDSVMRRDSQGQPSLMRRSRGFVPSLLEVPEAADGVILAAGGDLKNAPALAQGREIYLAPYIGDLDNPLTERDFRDQIGRILDIYGLEPDAVVCDLHPDYISSRWARSQPGRRVVSIQHHYAHLLSVMAEHGLSESIGLSFDGTGYGSDGTIWGGEFLRVDRLGFARLGCFAPFPLPGGEAAVLHPARTALALLRNHMAERELMRLRILPEWQVELILQMMDRKINTPLTSSVGRIFDAVASLLGLVEEVSYEGEGPIRLEGVAAREWESDRSTGEISQAPLVALTDFSEDTFALDSRPLIDWVARNRGRMSTGALALAFHRAMAEASLKGALQMREVTGLETLTLSGGVFQNILLRDILVPELERKGFRVYLNRRIPPGDGGLAVGQAYHTFER